MHVFGITVLHIVYYFNFKKFTFFFFFYLYPSYRNSELFYVVLWSTNYWMKSQKKKTRKLRRLKYAHSVAGFCCCCCFCCFCITALFHVLKLARNLAHGPKIYKICYFTTFNQHVQTFMSSILTFFIWNRNLRSFFKQKFSLKFTFYTTFIVYDIYFSIFLLL